MAQLRDRLWSTFGGDNIVVNFERFPGLRHREQIRSKPVLADQDPTGMEAAGISQQSRAEFVERKLHRIERMLLTGKQASLEHLKELFQRGPSIAGEKKLVISRKLGNRHAVEGESARLVGTKDRSGAERLDCGRVPRQNARPGDSPRSHYQKDSQDERELFRKKGHGDCDTGENRLYPAAPQQSVQKHYQYAESAANYRERSYHATGLPAKRARL